MYQYIIIDENAQSFTTQYIAVILVETDIDREKCKEIFKESKL
jgi:hypothetical protein